MIGGIDFIQRARDLAPMLARPATRSNDAANCQNTWWRH